MNASAEPPEEPLEIVLLGTAGGPVANPWRAQSANAVRIGSTTYLIDFGNGVARQLAHAGIGIQTVRAGFLTHHHCDHNADLGTLFHTQWLAMTDPVRLYGPPPLAAFVAGYLELQDTEISVRIDENGLRPLGELLEPSDVTGPGVVHRDELVTVTAAVVEHPPVELALAYRVDGPGRSVVFSGDTRPSDSLVELARGADVLVHEAIDLREVRTRLAGYPNAPRLLQHLEESHTPIEEVGAIAAAAGVATLVLTHLVPSDPSYGDDRWREQAAEGFDGEVIVGRDLLVV